MATRIVTGNGIGTWNAVVLVAVADPNTELTGVVPSTAAVGDTIL